MSRSVSSPPPIAMCSSLVLSSRRLRNAVLALEEDDEQDNDKDDRYDSTADIHEDGPSTIA